MKFHWTCNALSLIAVATALTSPLQAENWPQWRGSRYDGVSLEKNLPTRWSKTENVLWRLPLPGRAGATPVVWENRIFLLSVENDDLLLLCASTSGKELWRQNLGPGGKERYRTFEGSNASPSPCTDGQHVWACTGNGHLACYSVQGKQVWKFNLQDRYGKYDIAFGMSATPVLDGDRLYVQLIHGEGDPSTREAVVVALDKLTGDEIWKHDRQSDARKECEHSYASPMLYRDQNREYLITHGADYAIAHSLKDGSEIWRCSLNTQRPSHPTLRFVASPLVIPGMIIVPSAKNGPIVNIRPEAHGDITDNDSAFHWKLDSGTPDVSIPLAHDGLVYLYKKTGQLVCLDASNGKQIYQRRTTGGLHRSSPVFADGKIFLTARSGIVSVIKPGRQFEILAQNDLGEEITASPAISNGRIYLRTYDALIAIGH